MTSGHHLEMDLLAQPDERRNIRWCPEDSSGDEIYVSGATSPLPGDFTDFVCDEAEITTFSGDYGKRAQNRHSGSSPKSARIALIFCVGLSDI